MGIQNAFQRHVPRWLVCSRLLGSAESGFDPFQGEGAAKVEYISNMKYVKELVLTGSKAPLCRELLFYWKGLESVSLPNGHRVYESKDGILYKDHGTTLAFIPPCHPKIREGTFVIPWGVRRLGVRLFQGFTTLKRVEMPDSVCKLEGAVFAECERLEYVRLSDFLTRIPGTGGNGWAGYYSTLPTFYWCKELTQAHFPKNLVCLGEGAFQRTGIAKLVLPEGTEEVGADCFCSCDHLTEVFLPKSVKRVGLGAFSCMWELKIWAYEGSAKGLLSSFQFDYEDSITWVNVLDHKAALRICIPVPHSTLFDLESLLNEAWDGEKLLLDPLSQCIPGVTEEQRWELILVALCQLDKNAFAPFHKYRKGKLTDYGLS